MIQNLGKLNHGGVWDQTGRKTWSRISEFPWELLSGLYQPLLVFNNLFWVLQKIQILYRIQSPAGSENCWGLLHWNGSWDIVRWMMILNYNHMKQSLFTEAKLEVHQASKYKWKFHLVSGQTDNRHQSYKSTYSHFSIALIAIFFTKNHLFS